MWQPYRNSAAPGRSRPGNHFDYGLHEHGKWEVLTIHKKGRPMKVRIKFTKYGALRYVGHLDFMRSFQKIVRRSGVRAVFTKGFSPHMIMSFAAPLGVGLESLGEYVDFEMAYRDPYPLTKIEQQRFSQLGIENDELPPVPSEAQIVDMLNSECPKGVRILSVKRIEEAKGKAMALVHASTNVVFLEEAWARSQGIEDIRALRERLAGFMAEESIIIHKTTKKTESDIDIRPLIYALRAEEDAAAESSGSGSWPACNGDEPRSDAFTDKRNVYAHIIKAGYTLPVYMDLSTGSSANLKPETVVEAFCAYAHLTFDPLALRILRLDLFGEDGKALSETGRTF